VKRTASAAMPTLLAIILLVFAFNIQPAKTEPTTIVVPDDYPTIQEAIDAVSSGDTILVSEGTYAEGMIHVGKSLTILASGSVIVDGLRQGNVFSIFASDVIIEGFTIINSGMHFLCVGIFSLWSGSSMIKGNTITNCSNGVWMENSLGGNLVSDNVISGCYGFGVVLLQSHYSCSVINNSITSSSGGFYISSSDGNTISGNTITAFSVGIQIAYSKSNTISRNTITRNGRGIILSDSMKNSIVGNTIERNNEGMFIKRSINNSVHHNNFINNTQQVYSVASNNTWDNSYPSGGNYWSDYNGTDIYHGSDQNQSGSDGIGDTPYILDADNQDRYPLMTAWEPLPGDLNWDGTINIYDIVLAVVAYGSKSGDTHWNPHCDIAEPYGVIDIYDIVMICTSYGEEYLP